MTTQMISRPLRMLRFASFVGKSNYMLGGCQSREVRSLTLLLIVASLALSILGCASRSTSSRTVQPDPGQRQSLSPADSAFLETEWRLFSTTFSVIPSGGYPIYFRRDGTVESQNLGGVAFWRFSESGNLELLSKARRLEYSFRRDPQTGIYYFRYGKESSMPGLPVLIGPAGYPFLSYRPPEPKS